MRFITGLTCLVLSLVLISLGAVKEPECVLFLYHHKPVSEDLLNAYDWVVLDGENPYVEEIRDKFYLRRRAKLIGYMSVGEIERYRRYYRKLKKFAIGENPMWDSLVADVRQKEYREFLIEVVAKEIANRGFEGFLLDTLDSYRLVAKKSEYKEFQEALEELILALKRRYPDKMIVLNRGFELLERVHWAVDGIVVESLFYGLNERRSYVEVAKEERKKLIELASSAKAYNLPVIVIDYVDPKDRKRAREVIRHIESLGFVPYVGDRELSRVGFSPCSPLPRKIVLLYDSSITSKRQLVDVHRIVQMPLEYLGFVPVLYDVNEELPDVSPQAGYVGVVSMFISNRSVELDRWLVEAKLSGLKLFFLEDFPFFSTQTASEHFGISFKTNRSPPGSGFKVLRAMSGSDFEAPLKLTYTPQLIDIESGEAVVLAVNNTGQKHVPFAFTEWGGYALNSSLLTSTELWVYDPFEVFRKVFRTEPFPAPDVTTENGLRILTAHIDGDTFFGDAEFDPRRTTGEVMREEILKKYKIPHTVSIIEGEVAPYGLYPQKSKRLEEIARSIFSLPNVEVASHSFSHPFTWQPEYMPKEELKYGYNLNIPGYSLDFVREIVGSLEYVNSLSPQKRAKVFLWTGTCDPNEEQLRTAYRAGVFNVNGGDTTATEAEPFLTRISPMGVNYRSYFQVYAPVQNENIYTNEWTRPFWGYLNVLQTFSLTESPRRLKPVSLYYHFYSARKLASLNALKKVYETVLEWDLNPMFLSEYALRVLDFRGTAIVKEEGGFTIRNSGYLRTLRVDKSAGFPDLRESRGVLGFNVVGDVVYIHLDGSGRSFLKLTKKRPEWFNLISTNGQVVDYERNDNNIYLKLRSYVPLKVRFDTGMCKVRVNGEEVPPGVNTFEGGKEAEIEAFCPD